MIRAVLLSCLTANILAFPLDDLTIRNIEFDLAIAAARLRRQLADDGSTGYAPTRVDCPTGITWVRNASGLGQEESSFIQQRVTAAKWQSYFDSAGINPTSDLNLNLSATTPPVVGMGFSGGGYRAMISGGGHLLGTDSRNAEAVAAKTGGIGSVAAYMAGLSGGSWLVSSYYANQNRTPDDLARNVWNLSDNLIIPSDGVIDTVKYFTTLISAVDAKSKLGFNTAITDYWALALSNHLFPDQYRPANKPNLTMSALRNINPDFVPWPIIIAAEREQGTTVVAANATVWEFSPYEFGAWSYGPRLGEDNSIYAGAFTPIKYLGSEVSNGSANGTCYVGFDNLGFVAGTSATLFNAAYTQLQSTSATGLLVAAIEKILQNLGSRDDDIAVYPNPFGGFNSTSPIDDFPELDLVDAGETNQNIPIEPFLVPARNVDAVLAFDNSADTTYAWPNGSALWTTYNRYNSLQITANIAPVMPTIPDTSTFVNLGLNTHPTFFGCDTQERANATYPIIVYVPAYPWSAASNITTFTFEVEPETAVSNMYSTMRSFTLNASQTDWPTCLSCAMVDRAVARTNQTRSQACLSCFQKYCWDGTYNATTPDNYDPVIGSVPAFFGTPVSDAPGSPSASPTSAAGQTVASIGTTMLIALGIILASW